MAHRVTLIRAASGLHSTTNNHEQMITFEQFIPSVVAGGRGHDARSPVPRGAGPAAIEVCMNGRGRGYPNMCVCVCVCVCVWVCDCLVVRGKGVRFWQGSKYAVKLSDISRRDARECMLLTRQKLLEGEVSAYRCSPRRSTGQRIGKRRQAGSPSSRKCTSRRLRIRGGRGD